MGKLSCHLLPPLPAGSGVLAASSWSSTRSTLWPWGCSGTQRTTGGAPGSRAGLGLALALALGSGLGQYQG